METRPRGAGNRRADPQSVRARAARGSTTPTRAPYGPWSCSPHVVRASSWSPRLSPRKLPTIASILSLRTGREVSSAHAAFVCGRPRGGRRGRRTVLRAMAVHRLGRRGALAGRILDLLRAAKDRGRPYGPDAAH